jgi:hypothetical protein
MNYRELVFKRMIQILSVVLILGCASQPQQVASQPEAVQGAETTTQEQQPALISGIEAEENETAVRVLIKGSAPLTYEVTQAESPLRLIVDVAGAQLAMPGEPIRVTREPFQKLFRPRLIRRGRSAPVLKSR